MPVRKRKEDPKTSQEGTKSAARSARKVPRVPKGAPRVPPDYLESVPRPLSLQASERLHLQVASADAVKRKKSTYQKTSFGSCNAPMNRLSKKNDQDIYWYHDLDGRFQTSQIDSMGDMS